MTARPVPAGPEVLANVLLGRHDPAATVPPATGAGVVEALVEAVLPALRRPPCLVSFSGGRDSSAVLAVATHAARRHGLPDPVPATLRFPSAPASDETPWQEAVVRHLGLEDWVLVTLEDELDALGDVATAVLREHGLRWPANGYLHVPLLERARGGSLLTGAGGDELMDTRASRLVRVLRRRERPQPRDALRAALAAAPRAAREAVWRRREAPALPWLTAEGRDLVARALARDTVSWPGRWDASVRHWRRARGYAGLVTAVPALGTPLDVAASNPLMADGVLAEMLAAGGPAGFDTRTEAMRQIFGGLLPDPVLAREDKAAFGGPLWGPAFRAFAVRWSGAGVDPALVDVAALRDHWRSPQPSYGTLLLLQSAWLAEAGAGGGQATASSS